MKNSPRHLKRINRYKALAFLPVAIASLSLSLSPTTAFAANAANAANAELKKAKKHVDSPSDEQKHINAINSALPAGMTIANASKEALAAAVAQVLLANPSAAIAIVSAAINAASLSQATAIAEGAAKAFGSAKAVADQAPGIAKAFSEGIFVKTEPLPERANQLGTVTATLVNALDPSNPSNHPQIVSVVTNALAANPTQDYTNKAYDLAIGAIQAAGGSQELITAVTSSVVTAVPEVVGTQIVAQSPTLDKPTTPPNAGGQGTVTPQETSVINR